MEPALNLSANTPFLAARGLGFALNGRTVLSGVDLELRPGERVGLVGDNGSGKTTLLHCLLGLEKTSAGHVELNGQPVTDEHGFSGLRRQVGMVFQNPDDQLFSPTVLEDVAFGPLNLGAGQSQALDDAHHALAAVGCEHLHGRVTHELSGGEKKLVSLAGVLAMHPRALLLDEPEAALDRSARARLTDILHGLDAALLVVSHDLSFLDQVTGRLCLLENGVLDCDPKLAVHTHPHVHPMGHAPHRHDD